MATTVLFVVAMVTVFVTSSSTSGPENFNTDFETVACETRNKKKGLCVSFSSCTEDHTILPGGNVIHDLRGFGCPPLQWCCTNDFVVPTNPKNVSKSSQSEKCDLNNAGDTGVCLPELQCQSKTPALVGGNIGEGIIRSRNCPSGHICCQSEEPIKAVVRPPVGSIPGNRVGNNPVSTDSGNCSFTTINKCPWCAGLYRIGGNPRTMSPTGLYCAGVLIRPRVILTSGGCIIAGKNKKRWVQLPDSLEPNRKYDVISAYKNKQFNSGTHEFDIGLMELAEAVTYPSDSTNSDGVCFGSKAPNKPNCFSVEVNDDKLNYTPLQVISGSCITEVNTIDALCGTSDAACEVSQGAPLICYYDDSRMLVSGVAREGCVGKQVLLTTLKLSLDWVKEHNLLNAP